MSRTLQVFVWALTLSYLIASTPPVAAQTAASCDVACVLAGPRIASVDTEQSAILNPVLSGLLGSSVNLSAGDWNALATGDVQLLGLLDELEQELSLSSPEDVLNADLTLAQIIDAAVTVAQADGDTATVNALNGLVPPVSGLSQTIRLGDLLVAEFPDGSLADVNLNTLDLLTGAVQLYNYENAVTTPEPIDLSSPELEALGIGGARAYLQVVEPPQYVCGNSGTSFHTAAIRLKLDLDLLSLSPDTSVLSSALGGALGGLVTVDADLADLTLYLELGRAEGQVTSANYDTQSASVTLSPSLVDIYLGDIDDSVFFNTTRALQDTDVNFATAGGLDLGALGGLVNVSADIRVRAIGQSASPSVQTLLFAGPFPETQSVATNGSAVTDLLGTLVANLDVEVDGTLGPLFDPLVDSTIEPLLQTAVADLLVTTLTPLVDTTVDPLLDLLGVGIGEADATVFGVSTVCPDFGDCPISGTAPNGTDSNAYGIASHSISQSLFMGATPPDRELASATNADATGDDSAGFDDEDGAIISELKQGDSATITVQVTEAALSAGYLQAWIDWNGNGTFDAEEQLASDLQDTDGNGSIVVPVDVPATAVATQSFLRLRWSTTAGLGPDGAAPDGEVEDYAVIIASNQRVLSGRVFIDNGDGDAVAHDGLRTGAEAVFDRGTVSIFDDAGVLLGTAPVTSQGNWAFSLAADYTGSITYALSDIDGTIPISENTADLPGVVAGDPHDASVTFDPANSTSYTTLDFGVLPLPSLTQDQVAAVEAGQVTLLAHVYKATSTAEVAFSYQDTNSIPSGALSAALFADGNCDGVPDEPVSGPIQVASGDVICLVSRVSTSSGAQQGARLVYGLVAQTEFTGTTKIVTDRNDDLIIVGDDSGNILLSKTVENLTKGSPEGVSNAADPGDILQYRLAFLNPGSAPITDLAIYDTVPSYTALSEPIDTPVDYGNGLVCNLAVPIVNEADYAGPLQWNCPGSFFPGSRGEVTFKIRVSP